ncbi:MAG: alpha/beta fold hydrolase [Spirochaetota bacterium]
MHLEVLTVKPKQPTQKAPILFVHGMWHTALCWEENFLPYFAEKGYPTYALSLRGHGKSEGRKNLRWTRMHDYVADVVSVVTEQIGEKPILVGHSMGGMVVQKYLESQQCQCAILLTPVPPQGILGPTLRVMQRYPIAFAKANLTLSMYPIVGTLERCQEVLFSSTIPQEKLQKYFGQLQDESYLAYLDMILIDLPKHKKGFVTDMLVLGASNDAAISVAEVQATAEFYAAELKIFPDMAHNLMLEENWQNVADTMLAWLERKNLH